MVQEERSSLNEDNGSVIQDLSECGNTDGQASLDDRGMEDDDDALDALLSRKLGEQLKTVTKGRDQGPKEQIIEMAFILDRVPSYILVISKVFSSAS